MQIKICGITNEFEASYLNDSQVDYSGFVFYEKSKRNISLDKAKSIFKKLDSKIKKVAVMVGPTKEEAFEKEKAGFDIIQIHGEISDEVLDVISLPIWCAINLDKKAFDDKLRWLSSLSEDRFNKIEGLVIDSKNFGSGQTFDWQKNASSLQNEIFDRKKKILAGGLNPKNVGEAISIIKPDIVDVSSGVEKGVDLVGKDKELIKQFVNAVRSIS